MTSEHLADGEVPTRAPQSGASRHGVAEVDANGRQGRHNAKAEPNPDLEIKDAQLIFNRVWKELEDSVGRENLRFPKELILLGGAPGSGKGSSRQSWS